MARPLAVRGNGRPRPVRRSWLPGGDIGVYWTLVQMRDVVRAAVGHPILVQAVTDATNGATDRTAIWRGIRQWLTTHTQFQFDMQDQLAQADPDLIEIIHTPLDQLLAIANLGRSPGDCDDVATLAAALALTAGQRARFVVFGFDPRGVEPYRHVFTEIAIPGGWGDCDVTRRPSSPVATRRAALEV